MASKSMTYQADFETPASQGVAASIARRLAAFARPARGHGIWHDIGAWLVRIGSRSARALAEETRIRRDTRELMAWSDHMLEDIGLSRAEIGGAVRYGSDGRA